MARREIALEYKNYVISRDDLAEIMGKVQLARPSVDEVIIRCRGAKRTVYEAIEKLGDSWRNPDGRPIRVTIAPDKKD